MEFFLGAVGAAILLWIFLRARSAARNWRDAPEIPNEHAERSTMAAPIQSATQTSETVKPLLTPRGVPIRIVEGSAPFRDGPRRVAAESRLLFMDVETTGLSADDRIVSIGMLRIRSGDLLTPSPDGDYAFGGQKVHLVFNPERPSSGAARRAHGWPDDVLARQEPFSSSASTVAEMLEGSDIWLAHSAAFDLRFLEQEFDRLGRSLPEREVFCTMTEARHAWKGETAKLEQCAKRIGLGRTGRRHGALEDALLCAALYAYYQTGKTFRAIPDLGGPTNLVM